MQRQGFHLRLLFRALGISAAICSPQLTLATAAHLALWFPTTEIVVTSPPHAEYLRADSLDGLYAEEITIGGGLRVAASIEDVTVIDPCDDPDTRIKRWGAFA